MKHRLFRAFLFLLLPVLLAQTPAQADRRTDYIEQAVMQYYGSGLLRGMVGDWGNAVRDFERAYRFSPSSPLVLLKLSEAYLNIGRYREAEKMALRALDENPSAHEAYLVLGAISWSQGNAEQADSYLQKKLAADPYDIQTRLKLALIRQQQNDWEGVIEIFDEYPADQPGAGVAYHQMGIAHLQLEQYEEARRAFERVLTVRPDAADAVENIAIISEQIGDRERALKAWNRVTEINPTYAEAWRHKVSLYILREDYPKAQESLQALLAYDDDARGDPKMLHLLLQLALRNQDTPAVAGALIELGDAEASETQYIHAAVIAAQTSGETEQVVEALEGAWDLGKRHGVGLLLARTYAELGRTADAIKVAGAVVSRQPEDTGALWLLAILHARNSDTDQALHNMQRLIELDPDNAEALNYVGYTWAEQGEHLQLAEELIRRALQIDPDNPQYIDSLGWVYFQQGLYDAAVTELQRAHKLLPEEPTILDHLQQAKEKLEN